MTSHAPHTTCAHCGAAMRRAQRIDAGRAYCTSCYCKVFKPAVCVNCGQKARVLADDPSPLCQRCRQAAFWLGKTCVRCQVSLEMPRRHILDDGTVCCNACLYHLRPRTCAYCGTSHYSVSRDYVHGFEQPACYRCKKDALHLPNCAGCHRPRRIAGLREDGKGYCAACLPTGHPPLVDCVDCGKRRYAYSKTLCEDCGWARSHARVIKRLLLDLPVPWSRELFEVYHTQAQLKQKRGSWNVALRRDAEFFAQLGVAFASREEISAVAIVQRLGWEVTERHRRVMSFLAQRGLADLNDPDYEFERWLSRQVPTLLAGIDGWVLDVLQRFLSHLLSQRAKARENPLGYKHHVPQAAKSFDGALRFARSLLVFARDKHQADSVQEVTQTMLDLFISNANKGRHSGRVFVRYVRQQEHSFHRLRIPLRKRGFPMHLVMAPQKRRELIAAWSAIPGEGSLRLRLVALLGLVYAQSPQRAVRMTLDQVREIEGNYAIRFANDWVTLDPSFVPMMRAWLTRRREISGFEVTGTSSFLFPGKNATTHMRPNAVYGFVQSFGVTTRMLAPTAIATLIRHGLAQPRVLIDAFGIEKGQAAKACLQLGAFSQARAQQVLEIHGQ